MEITLAKQKLEVIHNSWVELSNATAQPNL